MAKKFDKKRLDSIRQLFKDNKVSRANAELLEYMNDYPDDDVAKFLYARVLQKAGETEEAKKIYENLYAFSDVKKDLVGMRLVKANLQLGNEKVAKELLEELIEEDIKKDEMTVSTLAIILLNDDKADEALELLNKYKFDGTRYKVTLARTLQDLGRVKAAEIVINKLDEIPEERDLIEALGITYYKMTKFEEAMNTFDKLSEKKDIHYYRAQTYVAKIEVEKANYSETIRICEDIINGNYNVSKDDVYIPYSTALQNLGAYTKAKEALEELIKNGKKADTKYEAIFRLGYLEQTAGHDEEASAYFDDCIVSGNKTAKRGYIGKIILAIKNLKYKEAEDYLIEALPLSDSSTEHTFRALEFLIAKGLNREPKISPVLYREDQIMNYSREAALNHIRESRSDHNPFGKNVNIEELFEEAQEYMTSENEILGDLFNIYVIDKPNVAPGVDKYKVVAVSNTKNIITMYPDTDNKLCRIKDYKECEEKDLKAIEERKQKKLDKFKKKNN